MILGLPEFDLKNVRKQKKICQVWRADSFRITNPLQQHPWARGWGSVQLSHATAAKLQIWRVI